MFSGPEHTGGCKPCIKLKELEYCGLQGMMCFQWDKPEYIKWVGETTEKVSGALLCIGGSGLIALYISSREWM